MDFNDTPDEAAYRQQVRTWLEANAPKKRDGSDPEGGDSMAASKAWQAKKAAAGYACITWPKEWGGQGGRGDTGIHHHAAAAQGGRHQVVEHVVGCRNLHRVILSCIETMVREQG